MAFFPTLLGRGQFLGKHEEYKQGRPRIHFINANEVTETK